MIAQNLASSLIAGDRRALAKAITLVESQSPADRAAAESLLAHLPAPAKSVIRVGVTGTPGAGKSTFIEALGMMLTAQGRRVAVLAVDPSSRLSGGSILGDKTRMEKLARAPSAFIRPSPAGQALGGVARRTRDAIMLVEAAGFDVVIVETVGVGQSETAVADMTDVFLLIHAPAGGDELQGVKRGVMELADIVAVNKADGDLIPAARRAAADLSAALHLMRPRLAGWTVPVLEVSALESRGVDRVWSAIESFAAHLGEGGLAERRAVQRRSWLWADARDLLVEALESHPQSATSAAAIEADLAAGRITPRAAAARLAAAIRQT